MFLLLILIQNILQNFLVVIDVVMQTSHFFFQKMYYSEMFSKLWFFDWCNK